MSLLPYSLARPFLFGLDPETAHELTLQSLARLQRTPLAVGLVQRPRSTTRSSSRACAFPNRVGLAAGLDKNARCIDGLGAMGFGFVEVGTVTPQAAAGQPEAAHVPPAAGRRADQPPRLQQRRARRLHRQRAARVAFARQGRILGLNIGKNAATPIERATDDYLPASTACIRTPTTSRSTSRARTPRTCARCKATRRSTRCSARSRARRERAGGAARPARADVRQDRARPRRGAGRRRSPRRCSATAWTA